MKTLDYDAAGMPVSVSVEYVARCLLLEVVAQIGPEGSGEYFFDGHWRERGSAPEVRPVLYRAKVVRENGVVEIVEFKTV